MRDSSLRLQRTGNSSFARSRDRSRRSSPVRSRRSLDPRPRARPGRRCRPSSCSVSFSRSPERDHARHHRPRRRSRQPRVPRIPRSPARLHRPRLPLRRPRRALRLRPRRPRRRPGRSALSRAPGHGARRADRPPRRPPAPARRRTDAVRRRRPRALHAAGGAAERRRGRGGSRRGGGHARLRAAGPRRRHPVRRPPARRGIGATDGRRGPVHRAGAGTRRRGRLRAPAPGRRPGVRPRLRPRERRRDRRSRWTRPPTTRPSPPSSSARGAWRARASATPRTATRWTASSSTIPCAPPTPPRRARTSGRPRRPPPARGWRRSRPRRTTTPSPPPPAPWSAFRCARGSSADVTAARWEHAGTPRPAFTTNSAIVEAAGLPVPAAEGVDRHRLADRRAHLVTVVAPLAPGALPALRAGRPVAARRSARRGPAGRGVGRRAAEDGPVFAREAAGRGLDRLRAGTLAAGGGRASRGGGADVPRDRGDAGDGVDGLAVGRASPPTAICCSSTSTRTAISRPTPRARRPARRG